MGLSKLSGLYREVILDHGDHPHHKNALPNANTCHYVEKSNLWRRHQFGYSIGCA